MTAADILKIVGTVAVTQVVIDVLANRWVFNTESYDRLCRALLRAQTLEAKARASKATNAEKHAKKLGKHVTEREALAALVAKKHATPAMGGSVAFLILYRILSAEHAGKVVAVLPFVPFRLLRRITLRGLDFGPEGAAAVAGAERACAFAFVYMLAAASAKFIVHKLLARKPPPGADGGFETMMEAPQSKAVMRSFGMDPDEFLKGKEL